MYGYEVVILSPHCDKRVIGLGFISPRRYANLITLLRDEGLYEQYRDWELVSFRCAQAATPESQPVVVERQIAEPGTLCTTVC